MRDRSLLSLAQLLAIGALIIVMVLGGTVAIAPRYIFFRQNDFGCCPDAGMGYGWLRLAELPVVVVVAFAIAAVKSWLDRRETKTMHRLL